MLLDDAFPQPWRWPCVELVVISQQLDPPIPVGLGFPEPSAEISILDAEIQLLGLVPKVDWPVGFKDLAVHHHVGGCVPKRLDPIGNRDRFGLARSAGWHRVLVIGADASDAFWG